MGGVRAEGALLGSGAAAELTCRPRCEPGDDRQAGWEVMPQRLLRRAWDYTNAECVEGKSNSPFISQQLGLWFLTIIIW